ncbi:MAG TPA: TonB-dependent receptor [Prolixibacteraceae bacterium]|nr:TonB-dependent receptor [Prolixibacteraceae bacterium]
MKHLFFLLSCCLITVSAFAQRHTISGYITDKASGERLINANVYEANTLLGTTANNYGFYSISLPKGKVKLAASFIGYQAVELEIDLHENKTFNIELEVQSGELSEVIVSGNRNKVEETQMSMIDVPIQKLEKIPVILGEADVLKVIQLLPGVQGGTEGTSGIYVRGGGPDQNLFLLDGVPVYNAGHLMGFFSVFNPDAIRTVKLYKGGFPARFGGRLSSVVDISMKDGNMQELKGEVSIGLISSKLMLEGPIVKNKTSFMVSARRTYIDILAKPVVSLINKSEDTDVKMGAYFHDINAKINHIFSDRSRLYLSVYHGKDRGYGGDSYDNSYHAKSEKSTMEWEDNFGLSWGNTIASLRWNYLIGPKLFSNTTLTYSKYLFNIEAEMIERNLEKKTFNKEYFRYYSGIEDLAAKIDFDYFPSPRHDVKFGASYTNHRFTPGVTNLKLTDTGYSNLKTDTTYGNRSVYANELSAYIEDDITISPTLKANIGAYLSTFLVDGEAFICPQPRASVRYKAMSNWSIKASYSRMAQHLHLLSMSGIDLPTDLWVPATKRFTPPIADHFALGSAFNINSSYSFTIEGFYKNMTNLIEYKDGASFMGGSSNWEDKVEAGRGWSYGLELLLEKTLGNTTGWIGYTWSKTERQFENINFGKIFPAKYDRRHDISVVVTHKFSDRFDIGGTWVYGTGNAATLSFSQFPTTQIPFHQGWSDYAKVYESRNNYRLPAYHRLDLGVNFHKQKKHGIRTWNVSVYNAYSRLNPFMLRWDSDWDDRYYNGEQEVAKIKLYKLSLFPIIPSVSYSFKF